MVYYSCHNARNDAEKPILNFLLILSDVCDIVLNFNILIKTYRVMNFNIIPKNRICFHLQKYVIITKYKKKSLVFIISN